MNKLSLFFSITLLMYSSHLFCGEAPKSEKLTVEQQKAANREIIAQVIAKMKALKECGWNSVVLGIIGTSHLTHDQTVTQIKNGTLPITIESFIISNTFPSTTKQQ